MFFCLNERQNCKRKSPPCTTRGGWLVNDFDDACLSSGRQGIVLLFPHCYILLKISSTLPLLSPQAFSVSSKLSVCYGTYKYPISEDVPGQLRTPEHAYCSWRQAEDEYLIELNQDSAVRLLSYLIRRILCLTQPHQCEIFDLLINMDYADTGPDKDCIDPS